MASTKDDGGEFQAPFPALHQCVVIDARHGSRVEINKDLKASRLFENIIEAKSVDDGIRVVERHAVDACFLGPTLSVAKASAFLRRATQSTYSKDTAFICLVPLGNPYIGEMEKAGAHSVFEIPCSKAKFTEGVVRGVVRANLNSPWSGILLNAERNNVNLFAEEAYGKRNVEEPVAAPSGGSKKASMLASLNVSSLIDRLTPEMQTLITDVGDDDYGLDAQGRPTERVAKAISKLVDRLLETGENAGKSPKFRVHFEAAINEWFVDLKQLGPQSATSELRRKLKSYSE